MDKLKIALALGCVVLGVWGYYYFADTAVVFRFLMVVGGLLAGAGVAWTSQPGKEFFAFVVIMALFLFAVDSSLAWAVKMLTGRVE
jgi:preprotein translocase subunit SecE